MENQEEIKSAVEQANEEVAEPAVEATEAAAVEAEAVEVAPEQGEADAQFSLDDIAAAVKEKVDAATEAAKPTVDAVAAKANEAIETAKPAIEGAVGTVAAKANEAIENAKQNAKRAGVAGCVEFRVGDARKVCFPENATVVANPPYGERLMTPEEAERLYRDFGANFLSQKARGLYLICSHPEFEKLFGKKADRRRKLYNGMIQSTLYMYFNK